MFVEVGDPLTPKQVAMFRFFNVRSNLSSGEAACLALGEDPAEGCLGHAEYLRYEIEQWMERVSEDICRSEPYTAVGKKILSTSLDVFDFDSSHPSREALRLFFEDKGLRPAFLYPEAWGKPKPADGETAPKAETDPPADPLPEFERMPRLLREAIRAWREFYDSGEEPPKKDKLIQELQDHKYAKTKAEAEAIDKIIRPDELKQGVPFRKKD